MSVVFGPRPYGLITIDHTKVSSTQTDFPVLISGTYPTLKTIPNGGGVANANGYDILFFSNSSLTTRLKWEVERYIPTTGEIIYWVKVPTLSSTVDTNIYVAYGNSSITTDQSTPTEVWDSNYVGVWHLPDGITLTTLDSTSNVNNGTVVGSTTATTGKIDGGANFANSNITVSSSSSINLSGAFSFSVWASANVLPPTATLATVFHKDAVGDAGYELGINGTDLRIISYNGSDHGAVWTYTLTTGVLYHISGGYDGTTWYLRVNAVQRATSVDATGAISGTGSLLMGQSYGARYWDGVIDNLTLSNSYRSTDWYDTEYNNQSSPSTFYAISFPF